MSFLCWFLAYSTSCCKRKKKKRPALWILDVNCSTQQTCLNILICSWDPCLTEVTRVSCSRVILVCDWSSPFSIQDLVLTRSFKHFIEVRSLWAASVLYLRSWLEQDPGLDFKSHKWIPLLQSFLHLETRITFLEVVLYSDGPLFYIYKKWKLNVQELFTCELRYTSVH